MGGIGMHVPRLTRELSTIAKALFASSDREAEGWVFADAGDVREATAGRGAGKAAGYACLLVGIVSSRTHPAVWRLMAVYLQHTEANWPD